MEPKSGKIIRACAILGAAFTRFRRRLELVFVSKSDHDRRASGRALRLDQEVSEAERLDRLRNPRRYQGR